MLNSLLDNKILDLTKFKAFADGKIILIQKFEIYVGKSGKYCGKRRKCWLPPFSPISTMFSNPFFSRGVKVGIVW